MLLAGGAASRFGGAPKGLALVDGERIADRVLAALRDATERQVVVANDPRAVAWFPGETVVADEVAGLGPLAGLRTALGAARGAAVLVVAWDMPFVSPALLRALRAVGEPSACAVGPVHGERAVLEPLCAYYPPAALATCERLVAQGERRAGALFESMPGSRRLEGPALAALGDPSRLLTSIDTPEALGALEGTLPRDDDATRR